MLGTREFAGICLECQMLNIGVNNDEKAKCSNCGSTGLQIIPIPDDAIIPDLCDDCKSAMESIQRMVNDGGCLWHCEDCGHNGAFGPLHPIAEDMHANHPDKKGALLNKVNCPVCQQGGLN